MIFLSLMVSLASALAASSDPAVVRVVESVPRGEFRTGIGSTVRFELPDSDEQRDGIFLGKLREPDGTQTGMMILDTAAQTIYYLDKNQLKMSGAGMEEILDLYDQTGGTCTGYAMYHYMQQMHLSGFGGTGKLAKMVSTEQGRTRLLVDSVNEYYIETRHRLSIRGTLDGYGKDFGFKCKMKKFDKHDTEGAKALVVEKVSGGRPLILSFELGRDMVTSGMKLVEIGQKKLKLDRRLWVPRQIGQRNGGGHTIVGVATFEYRGKTHLVVLDSDWDQPRVWNLDDFFNDRTDVSDVEFISCEEKD